MRKEKAIVQIMMVVMMIGMILSKNTKVVASELKYTSGSCGDSCSYQFNKDTGELVITGSGEIDTISFRNVENIVDVKIGEGVTSIGKNTFYGCKGLTSIMIPEGVTSIGDSAFYGCTGLTSITLPEGVTSIGNSAFNECAGLTSITLPDSVANVGRNVFPSYEDCIIYCSDELLKNESFKDNYKYYWCITPSTKKIEEQAGRNTKVSIDAETFTLTFSGDGKVYSDYKLPVYTRSHIKNVVIDSEVGYVLEDFVKLENIIITYKCKEIKDFSGCSNLLNVTIPNSITQIGDEAFEGCEKLAKITIPNSVTSIGDCAFNRCAGLTSITIPEGITSIGNYAFKGCEKLAEITIPNSVTEIGDGAFEDCISLTNIIIPEGVKSISAFTFSNCPSLETITIPESVVTIAYYAFEHCDKMTIHCVEGSAAEKYAKDNDIPYVSVKSTKPAPTDGNSDSSGNNTSNTNDQSNNNQNQPADTPPANLDQKPADATNQGMKNDTLQNNSATKFNIKKNKTYKKTRKITISDNDGIKSVKLNGKTIKVKKGVKKISFKLSKYKKMLKSKKKANTLTVTDIKGVKSSVKFKVK